MELSWTAEKGFPVFQNRIFKSFYVLISNRVLNGFAPVPLQRINYLLIGPLPRRLVVHGKSAWERVKEFGRFNGVPSDSTTNHRMFGSSFSATRGRGMPLSLDVHGTELTCTFISLYTLSSLTNMSGSDTINKPQGPLPQPEEEGFLSLTGMLFFSLILAN